MATMATKELERYRQILMRILDNCDRRPLATDEPVLHPDVNDLAAFNHARYISDAKGNWSALSNHIYDQTVTARVDINRHWNFKVEGHFIDGYGSISSARGFYLGQNPKGLQPKTNLLALRTGFNF